MGSVHSAPSRLKDMLRLTLVLLLQLWPLAAFGQEFFVSTKREDQQFHSMFCCWIHSYLWMCGRWSPRRRTLVVKPTHLVWSWLNSWSAMVECLCTSFFFNQYRLWVLLRLRHWKPNSWYWHILWLALWAPGHHRYIIKLRLAGHNQSPCTWWISPPLYKTDIMLSFTSLPVWSNSWPESLFLKDQCDSNPCLNGGKCDTGADGSFMCSCPEPYTGKRCQTGVTFYAFKELRQTNDKKTLRKGEQVLIMPSKVFKTNWHLVVSRYFAMNANDLFAKTTYKYITLYITYS